MVMQVEFRHEICSRTFMNGVFVLRVKIHDTVN